MQVATQMTQEVVTVDPTTSLPAAFALMQESEIRHLAVMVGQDLVGVLSERDILLQAGIVQGQTYVPDLTVADVMKPDVVTCHPSCQIEEVVSLMLRLKIGSLPVVDNDGHLVGMLTRSDLLRLLSQYSS